MGDERNQQLTLRDGRRLGVAEYGPAEGEPIFYFHGWPGSRIEPQAVADAAPQTGARIIAVDRPGYGLSDFQPQRRIIDWPADVAEVADRLGLATFRALGVSGGGAYAAVCAARMPERVTGASLVCSVGPLDTQEARRNMSGYNGRLLFLARTVPFLVRWLAGPVVRATWRYETQVLPPALAAQLPRPDQLVLARPRLREALLASWREAFRSGTRGMVWDGLLYAWPWGFELEEIHVPVRLWHGELDVCVPAVIGRRLAARLKNCRAEFFPEEGHFSLPFGRIREILDTLLKVEG